MCSGRQMVPWPETEIESLSEQAENNPVGFRECAHNMYTQHRNSTLQLMDTGHISFIELFF